MFFVVNVFEIHIILKEQSVVDLRRKGHWFENVVFLDPQHSTGSTQEDRKSSRHD